MSTVCPSPHRTRPRRGSVLVQSVICLIPILGVIALTLDGGSMLAQRRKAQATADAAAPAAGGQLFLESMTYKGLDGDGKAAAAARTIASNNGYTGNGTSSRVTVNV